MSKNDLFLAVLAMDAYNRGDGQTIKIEQTAAIGTATIKDKYNNPAATLASFSVELTHQPLGPPP